MQTRHFPWTMLIVLCSCTTVYGRGPRQSATAAEHYERFISPLPLNKTERRFLRVVRQWGKQHGNILRLDKRLRRSAHALLRNHPVRDDGGFDLPQARRLAQQFGMTDGQMVGLLVRAESPDKLAVDLAPRLSQKLGDIEVNRYGLAVKVTPRGTSCVILMSRHLLDLWPIPKSPRKGSVLLSGRIASPTSPLRSVQLVVGDANGHSSSHMLHVKQGRFARRITLQKKQPTQVQFLIDRGKGPQIAAGFTLGDPKLWPKAESSQIVGNEDPVQVITQLILGTRSAMQLNLLAQSTRLNHVAQLHADDMCQHHFFAHVSPTHGDAAARVQQHGLRYRKVLENIASSESVMQAFEAWMASPLIAPTSSILLWIPSAWGSAKARVTGATRSSLF
ncbi:MAG: CAP domain-containing protein [Myxococcota bacterium]